MIISYATPVSAATGCSALRVRQRPPCQRVDGQNLSAYVPCLDVRDSGAGRIASAVSGLTTAEVLKRLSGGIAVPARTLQDLAGDPAVLAARYFEPLVRPAQERPACSLLRQASRRSSPSLRARWARHPRRIWLRPPGGTRHDRRRCIGESRGADGTGPVTAL